MQQQWCLQEPSIGIDNRPSHLETLKYQGLQRNIRGFTRVNLVTNMEIYLFHFVSFRFVSFHFINYKQYLPGSSSEIITELIVASILVCFAVTFYYKNKKKPL